MKSTIRNITFIILFSLLILQFVSAQPVDVGPRLTDGTNFHTIQLEMNDFYKDQPRASGYKQWKRKEWFLEPRLYPSGKMENLTLKTWKEYNRYLKSLSDSRATHGSWSFLGPTSNTTGLGRLNCIAFHPTDANIFYVGSSNGGIWKTTNGGTSWLNITPNIPLLSIADIKLSPSNPNVIYALTGDGDPDPNETGSHGQTEVSSIGILRSTDAGGTWYPTNFSFDHPSMVVPTKLLIHPSDVNTQFVVAESGIYRTIDHWENWNIEWVGTAYDIEFKPGDPNIMYAGGNNEILKSTNGGDIWNNVTDADFSFGSVSRVEIAIAPNNANVVYALAGNWSGFIEFYQSTSSGSSNTWTSQNTTVTTLGSYTDYCVALIVDPGDWTDVFGGMQWINRSLDEGENWTSIVDDAVHADLHDVAYRNGALWVCCDGGLYKSTDEGDSWTELTAGLAITEYYRIAGTPLNTNLYFGGAQDNGTMRRNGATSNFDVAFGNDGMTPMIDYTNSDIVYASSQNGYFVKSTTGGGDGSFVDVIIPGGEGEWITPAIMDPSDPEILFVGKENIYRSDDGGDNWENLGAPTGSEVNCLAQGTSNRNRLYVSDMAAIYRSDNALVDPGPATWTNIGAGLVDLFITGIAVDPSNSLRVFVSLSGYSDGLKVYRSIDGGVMWTNISGSLPNVPFNCIAFDENGSGGDALYVGSDVGVFYRDNALGDWIYYSNFIPAVNISDLYINDADHTIVAGTYGRGLWRSTAYDGCLANVSISNLFGIPVGGVRFFGASNSITSSSVYKKDIGTEIHYKSGNYIDLITDFTAGTLGFFEGRIGNCPDIFIEPLMSPFSSTSYLIMNEPEKENVMDDRPR